MKIIPRTRINIGTEELKAALKCIALNKVVAGPNIQKFENELKDYLGVDLIKNLKNGRNGLWVALKSIAKKKNEVVIPAYVCSIIPRTVIAAGFKPIFCDVDRKTYNIDPEKLNEVVTPKTAAVIPINLFGQSAEFKTILEITNDKKVVLIEDNAQALGAEYERAKTGTFGDFSIFSFGIGKNINCGGGSIRYNKEFKKKTEGIIKKCKSPPYLRLINQQINYFSYRILSHPLTYPLIHKLTFEKMRAIKQDVPYNLLISNIESSIGEIQLGKLDKINQIRIKNAREITEEIRKNKIFEAPHVLPNSKHVFLRYAVKLRGITQKEVIQKLLKKGIEAGLQREDYPLMMKKEERKKFPVAEELSRILITLPVDPLISKDEMEKIKQTIRHFENE